jgi:hypothetical protein
MEGKQCRRFRDGSCKFYMATFYNFGDREMDAVLRYRSLKPKTTPPAKTKTQIGILFVFGNGAPRMLWLI